ncbi:LysR family transcriptional regulator [Halomonas denitrificans]|nr:LysR family transcriptional regulator [Halomonas denitrificans]
MNFSIEQLLSFVTVYEERSFSKAAAKLNKHRTTTGQVITSLEDTLAVELFERVGKSVEPTEEGHVLYHYAKLSIDQSRIFNKIALSLSFGGQERVNFAYPNLIPHGLLAAIREQLARDFPNLRVNFLVRSKQEIEQGIEDGTIHFGLVNVDQAKGMFSKDSTLIGHIELAPFVKRNGDLAKVPAGERLNALRTSRQFILSALVNEGLQDKLVLSADNEEVEQLALAIKFVQSGLGWTWLPRILSESQYVTEHLEVIKLDELKQGVKLSFALWNPHSKPVLSVKKSILEAVDHYIQHFLSVQAEEG